MQARAGADLAEGRGKSTKTRFFTLRGVQCSLQGQQGEVLTEMLRKQFNGKRKGLVVELVQQPS